MLAHCRQGFETFFSKVGVQCHIHACGPRETACKDFCLALATAKPGECLILLIDSETPVARTEENLWEHLLPMKSRGWKKAERATSGHLHFMVLCMEAWFMADKAALAEYFGTGFDASQLPAEKDIESISKGRLKDGLEKASEPSEKGKYKKGRHSFAILSMINPEKVTQASPYAQRLIATVRKLGLPVE